jgi:hypothetical protein
LIELWEGAAQQAHAADRLIEGLIVADFRFCGVLGQVE